MELTKKVKLKELANRAVQFFAISTTIIIFFDLTISIYEYINVGLLNHIENYPWGKEEKEYWNYETPQIYSKWALTTSLSAIAVLTIDLLVRKKLIYVLLINLCFIIIMGYISDCKAEERYSWNIELRTTSVLRYWG